MNQKTCLQPKNPPKRSECTLITDYTWKEARKLIKIGGVSYCQTESSKTRMVFKIKSDCRFHDVIYFLDLKDGHWKYTCNAIRKYKAWSQEKGCYEIRTYACCHINPIPSRTANCKHTLAVSLYLQNIRKKRY